MYLVPGNLWHRLSPLYVTTFVTSQRCLSLNRSPIAMEQKEEAVLMGGSLTMFVNQWPFFQFELFSSKKRTDCIFFLSLSAFIYIPPYIDIILSITYFPHPAVQTIVPTLQFISWDAYKLASIRKGETTTRKKLVALANNLSTAVFNVKKKQKSIDFYYFSVCSPWLKSVKKIIRDLQVRSLSIPIPFCSKG